MAKTCRDDFAKIEPLFEGYIGDIEKQAGYREEIGNSRTWLLKYALEYAEGIWTRTSHADGAERPDVSLRVLRALLAGLNVHAQSSFA